MIDTVNILVLWTLAPEIAQALQSEGFYASGDWYFQLTHGLDRETGGNIAKLSGYNKRLGILLRGKGATIEWVQASLPRLLHGYNGLLIKNPQELSDSLERLFKYLGEISVPVETLIEFIRVDLVLNLPFEPKRLVLAHRNARHQWVRNEDVQYERSGIRFPGKERVLQLYWKQKERADKLGFRLPELSKSTRIEIQLKSKKVVRQLLGSNDLEAPVTSLDFFHCYHCFRHALCLFDKDIPLPDSKKCSLLNLIAECEAQRFTTSWGASALEWYTLSGHKNATLNRNRAAIHGRKRKILGFSWADVLPPIRLPNPVVDIYPDGREVEVTAW